VFGRKFLGCSFWVAKGGAIRCRVADKPLATFTQRVRQLTRHSGGLSMTQVIQGLRPYLLGWKVYFGLAAMPRVWRTLDDWLRHQLRAIQLKHWKRGSTMRRELLALGASPNVARTVAANSRRWWHNSGLLLYSVLTIGYCDALGLPRLS
jgi:RNA-directed DNA polymerase